MYIISFMRINTVNITKVKSQFSTTIKTSITCIFKFQNFDMFPQPKRLQSEVGCL